jgi:hypothetical protein
MDFSLIFQMIKNFLGPLISSALVKSGIISPDVVSAVLTDVSTAVATDPVAVNQMNLEPLHTSRVVQGSTGALIVGIATGIYGWSIGDQVMMLAGVTAVVTAGWALYGRIANGLAPVGTPAVKVVGAPVVSGIAPAGTSIAKGA